MPGVLESAVFYEKHRAPHSCFRRRAAMAMSVAAMVLSILLAALMGFAAHRSGVCTVKAVMELVTTGRAFLLASFWRAALWVMVVDLVVYWAGGAQPIFGPAVRLSYWPFIGGVAFGMGAAMNKGCAFSTLNRLGGGDLGMLVTLIAFFLGSAAMIAYPIEAISGPVEQLPGLLMHRQDVVALLTLILVGWVIRRTWYLWKERPHEQGPRQMLLSERYRLSTGAALIGLSAGILFALQGAWLYTSTVRSLATMAFDPTAGPSLDHLLLFAAVLFGIVVSVWQRRAFRLQAPGPVAAMRHFGGGMMMGVGATMIPGGNDVLVLQTIPLLLPHAILAYLGVLLGIFLILVAMKFMRQEIKRLDCSGDICWED